MPETYTVMYVNYFLVNWKKKGIPHKKTKRLDLGNMALVVGLGTKEIVRYIKAEIDRTRYRTQRGDS